MPPLPLRPRSNSRDKILESAAAIVREVGSGRLTLDAVALRAGISKGGLLYNFPSKDALLQGMIERIVDEVGQCRERIRAGLAPGRNFEARLVVATLLEMRTIASRDMALGVIAAAAENPGLLAPVRDAIRQTFEDISRTSDHADHALICWLAVEGLCCFEMHGISPLSEADRARVVAAMEGLLLQPGGTD